MHYLVGAVNRVEDPVPSTKLQAYILSFAPYFYNNPHQTKTTGEAEEGPLVVLRVPRVFGAHSERPHNKEGSAGNTINDYIIIRHSLSPEK